MPICQPLARTIARSWPSWKTASSTACRTQHGALPGHRSCILAINARSLHVGTVSLPSASDAILDDLVKSIPSADLKEDDLALLVLLTAGLARAAKDDDLPVRIARAALNRLPTSLETVTAVVDGVTTGQRADGPSEGFAYALCSRQSTPLLLTSTQLRSAANKPGALTFQFTAARDKYNRQWNVQLPLAQTIFSTGLTSTLIHRVYGRSPTQDFLQPIAERYLEGLTFCVPESSSRSTDLRLSSFPLLPLTQCQTVKESMGNIVRTVADWKAGDVNKEEPASRRLEEAVTAYFTARNAPPEPVNVWALIIPKAVLAGPHEDALDSVLHSSADLLHNIWASRQDQALARQSYLSVLPNLLESGGRLVKVLSGGGGWGKKAGLLSLDPDLEYSTRELRDDFGWSFDFDDMEGQGDQAASNLDQALGKSVQDGDGLIFLVADKQHVTADSDGISAPTDESGGARFLLGNCATDQQDMTTKTSNARYTTTFQAFSETGMAVSVLADDQVTGKSKLEVPGLSLEVLC